MLYFLTSNNSKFIEAKNFLTGFGICVERKSIDVPEIQAKESTEISIFSAEYASTTVDNPFFVMDRSFHIEALGGFPGPYVKYVNNWFNIDNVVSLFKDIDNFNAYWQTSIVYSNEGIIKVFEGKLKGKLLANPRGDNGWLFDKFFVPENLDKTLAELSDDISDNFWTSCNSWGDFVDFLKKEKSVQHLIV